MVGCRRNGPIAMPSAGPSPLGDRLGHRLALKKIRPPLPRFESQRLVSVGYAWLAGQMGALLAEKRFANADEKGALRMIFDLLKNAGTYQNLPAIYRALQYLQTLDPAALPESRVEISVVAVSLKNVRLTSKPFESCVFEAHRRYIDIHYIVSGVEGIGVASVGALTPLEPFSQEKDIGFYQGEHHSLTFLHSGEFMVCWPEDAHKVAIAQDAPAPIIKLVAKVAVEE